MHDLAVGSCRSMSAENDPGARRRAICGNFRWQKWIPWRFLGLEQCWPAIICTNFAPPRDLTRMREVKKESGPVTCKKLDEAIADLEVEILSLRMDLST